MLHNQRTFVLACTSCGHVSHITVVGSVSDEEQVRCPDCGEALGRLGQKEGDDLSEAVDDGQQRSAAEQTATQYTLQRRRAASLDATQRQRSSALVKPFLGRISDWQARSAFLRAELTAARKNEAQRLAIRLELGDIRNELLATLEAVQAVAKGAVSDGRIKDVLLALDRLDELLVQSLRAGTEDALAD